MSKEVLHSPIRIVNESARSKVNKSVELGEPFVASLVTKGKIGKCFTALSNLSCITAINCGTAKNCG